MTNLHIHKFSVDQASGNVESVTFVRDDGTLQTFNNENQTISASFTENGTYIPPTGFTGFDSVEINVPPSGKLETITVELDGDAQTIRPDIGFDGIGEVRIPKSNLQSLSVSLTPNNTTYVAADDGYYGFSQVTVPGYASLEAPCTIQDLEDANIRLGFSKTVTPQDVFGSDTNYKAFSSFQLPPAILQAKEVQPTTEEVTYRPEDGAYGFSEVTVDSVNTILETATFTDNGTYTPSGNKAGFSEVTVDVDLNLEELNIERSGTYFPSEGYNGFSKVVADLQPNLQEKTVSYTTNNTSDTVTPDSGYDGLSKVNVSVEVPIEAQLTDEITSNDTYYYTPSHGYEGIEELVLTVAVPTLVSNPITLYYQGSYPEGYFCDTIGYNSMNFDIRAYKTSTSPIDVCVDITTNVSNVSTIRLCGTLYSLVETSTGVETYIRCDSYDVTAAYGTPLVLHTFSVYDVDIANCYVTFQYVEVTDTSNKKYIGYLSGNATMAS